MLNKVGLNIYQQNVYMQSDSQISHSNCCTSQIAFKNVYVNLTKTNNANNIAKNVIAQFNARILPLMQKLNRIQTKSIISGAKSGSVIQKPTDLVDKINVFILGGGLSERLKPITQEIGPYNKIDLPFVVNREQDVHMLDFSMALSRHCIQKSGIQALTSNKPLGSFGDIIKYYLDGNEIKDTIVGCGDNIYDIKASELMKFFVSSINDSQQHMALVGTERSPQEIAGRTSVLKVFGDKKNGIMKLVEYIKKPKFDEIMKLSPDKQYVSNTSIVYLSKETMTKLIEEIRNNSSSLQQDTEGVYDISTTMRYISTKIPQWFKKPLSECAQVKLVKNWEDIGEPKPLYKALNEIKKGHYLQNFPRSFATAIRKSLKQRVKLEGKTPAILFERRYNSLKEVPEEEIKTAPVIDGVHIVK